MQEYDVCRLNRGNAYMSAGVDAESPSQHNTWVLARCVWTVDSLINGL